MKLLWNLLDVPVVMSLYGSQTKKVERDYNVHVVNYSGDINEDRFSLELYECGYLKSKMLSKQMTNVI